MTTIWFILVAAMLTTYVVLDGFDLGVGAIQWLVAKTPKEREMVLQTIGPVWDGNEVWLVASGGTLYLCFPQLYATSFSGFYLPLMMVLWLLMLRGMGIELRHQIHHPLWHSFWDFIFSVASLLLAVFLGVAFGNVIRGVPIKADGYFFEPLWTTFRVTADSGILDWFTMFCGLVALITLATHGANYIALKTQGDIRKRSHRLALWGSSALIVLTILSLVFTVWIRPNMLSNYNSYFWGGIFPFLVVASLAGIIVFRIKGNDLGAFLCSSGYLVGMLGGAAFGLYPILLPSATDPSLNLTIYNSATSDYGLKIGLTWGSLGMVLTLGYFTYLYRSFRGKVTTPSEEGAG